MKALIKTTFQTTKNLQKTIVVASLMSISLVSAHAESVLLVGENTVITNIDGQRIESGLLSSGPKKFNLPAGKHNITAKYDRLYELGRDEHDVLRSVEIMLPVILSDNQSYTIDMINQPNRYKDAVKYAEKPTLGLMSNGKVITQKTAIQGSSSGIFGSLGSIFTGNTGGQETVTVKTTANVPEASSQPKTPVKEDNVLDSFMKIWLKATPTERQKIKDWVEGQ